MSSTEASVQFARGRANWTRTVILRVTELRNVGIRRCAIFSPANHIGKPTRPPNGELQRLTQREQRGSVSSQSPSDQTNIRAMRQKKAG